MCLEGFQWNEAIWSYDPCGPARFHDITIEEIPVRGLTEERASRKNSPGPAYGPVRCELETFCCCNNPNVLNRGYRLIHQCHPYEISIISPGTGKNFTFMIWLITGWVTAGYYLIPIMVLRTDICKHTNLASFNMVVLFSSAAKLLCSSLVCSLLRLLSLSEGASKSSRVSALSSSESCSY